MCYHAAREPPSTRISELGSPTTEMRMSDPTTGRHENGRFAEGNPGGPGRPAGTRTGRKAQPGC